MKNLKTYILPISSLFLSITFLAIGYGIMITYIGVYLKQAGASSFSIGLINSAFFLGAIASSIFSQKIISTIGHIRSFASFAALMVIAFLLHSVYLNEFFWGFLRLISGFSFYALLIIVESPRRLFLMIHSNFFHQNINNLRTSFLCQNRSPSLYQ